MKYASSEIRKAGYQVSPFMDRQYFHFIYYPEPGNILFEGATDLPGFTINEPQAQLGNSLKLPPWREPYRNQIERSLPKISLPE